MAQNKGESTCATMPQVCIIWFSFTSNWTGLYNHIQWFILFPWWNRCTEYTGIRFLWMFWVPSRFTFFQWIHIRVYQAETMLQVCTLLPTIPHLDITSWNRDIYISRDMCFFESLWIYSMFLNVSGFHDYPSYVWALHLHPTGIVAGRCWKRLELNVDI